MGSDLSFLPERRRHGRTKLQMRLKGIRLDPDGGDVVDTLQTVDISRSGLGAYGDRGFYPGQRMVLCLPVSQQSGRRSIYATIVRCRQLNQGYEVGLEFDSNAVGEWCGTAACGIAAA